MRKRCILKKSVHCGASLYRFEPCKSGDNGFDSEYVSIFVTDVDETPIMTLHRSNIIEVPDDVPTERRLGMAFPAESWLRSVWDEWQKE